MIARKYCPTCKVATLHKTTSPVRSPSGLPVPALPRCQGCGLTPGELPPPGQRFRTFDPDRERSRVVIVP